MINEIFQDIKGKMNSGNADEIFKAAEMYNEIYTELNKLTVEINIVTLETMEKVKTGQIPTPANYTVDEISHSDHNVTNKYKLLAYMKSVNSPAETEAQIQEFANNVVKLMTPEDLRNKVGIMATVFNETIFRPKKETEKAEEVLAKAEQEVLAPQVVNEDIDLSASKKA